MPCQKSVGMLALSALSSFAAFAGGIVAEQTALPLEKVTLQGPVGEKMDALFAARALSAKAQGKIFNEAVNAFRTHWDDTHDPGHGYWQGEYWGKTMLGYTAAARYYDNADLKRFIRAKSLELIREFQRGDGYLGTYADATFVGALPPKKPWSVWTCNLWNRKYTIWGLFEAYQVTGDREILDGAASSMRQWIDMLRQLKLNTRLTGSFTGLMSMSVLKPLLLIWEETKDPAFFAYAQEIVKQWDLPNGSDEDAKPNLIANAFNDTPLADWYKQDSTVWAKAYEMQSCIEGLIEYARVTGDARVFEATKRLQKKLVDGELNPMGSVGHFDRFANAAKRPLGMSEPCDVVHWMRLNRELFLLTGDGRYFDALELCFYNAYLASVYRGGEWGAHMIRSEGSRHRPCPPQTGMLLHQCCIDNAPRGFADFASVVVTESKDGAVCVNSYQKSVSFAKGVGVTVMGNYPVSDTVSVRVDPSGPFKLRLRVPGWCRKMTVSGKEVPAGAKWYDIDVPHDWTYVVKFEMPVEIVRRDIPDFDYPAPCAKSGPDYGNWATYRYAYVSENPEMKNLVRGKAFANLRRGPLMLAKCRLAGASRAETLENETINREDGWTCTLEPLWNRGTWGAWTATLCNGERCFRVNVSDYASAADFDDAENWFSLNF